MESRAQMPQLAGLKPAQKRKIHQELESGALSGDAQWASRDEVWDDEPPNLSPTKSLTLDCLSVVSAPPAASFGAQHYRNDGVGRGTTGPTAGAAGAFATGAGATSASFGNSSQQQRIPCSYAAAAASAAVAASAAASSSSASNSNSYRRLAP